MYTFYYRIVHDHVSCLLEISDLCHNHIAAEIVETYTLVDDIIHEACNKDTLPYSGMFLIYSLLKIIRNDFSNNFSWRWLIIFD